MQTALCRKISQTTAPWNPYGERRRSTKNTTPNFAKSKVDEGGRLKPTIHSSAGYKHHFGSSVRSEPTIKVRDYIFVDRLHLAAIAADDTEEMACCRYNKLLRRTSEPLQSTQRSSTYSKHRRRGHTKHRPHQPVLRCHCTSKVTDNLLKTTQRRPSQHRNWQEQNAVRDTKNAASNDSMILQVEVSRLMRYEDTPQKRRYVLKWYGYGPMDKTSEPQHYIPAHFIKE